MTAGNFTDKTAMNTNSRCPQCGRRSAVAESCQSCGHVLQKRAAPVSDSLLGSLPIQPVPESGLAHSRREVTSAPHGSPLSALAAKQSRKTSEPFVRGRVLIIHQEAEQTVDFDPWRPLAWLLWVAALVVVPPCVLAGIWMYAGPLAGIVSVLVCLLLASFVMPKSLLGWVQLIFYARGREPIMRVPVLFLRVHDEDGREFVARLKGQMAGANIAQGDRITIWGRNRRGVMRVRRAFSETADAWVTAWQPSQAKSTACAAVLLCACAVWVRGPLADWAHGIEREMKQRIEVQRESFNQREKQWREQQERRTVPVRRASFEEETR